MSPLSRRVLIGAAAMLSTLIAVPAAEAGILTEFLPQQLAEGEIEELVRAAVSETGANGRADLGRVMGRVAPQTKGRADGKLVSDIARRVLGGT